jgi:hypothetical protein
MRITLLCVAAGLTAGLPAVVAANDLKANSRVQGSSLTFEARGASAGSTVSVAGPNRFTASAHAKGGGIGLDLSRFGTVEDGTYTYQVHSATDEAVKPRAGLDNGRGPGAPQARKSLSTSGTFVVKGGVIQTVTSGSEPQKQRRDDGK